MMKSLNLTVKSIFVILLLKIVFVSLTSNLKSQENLRKSKSVSTILSAKWKATPIVLEVAEYLSEDSNDLFWSFLNGINDLNIDLDSLATEKEIYDTCIDVVSSLLSPAQLRLLKLSISMHTLSPKVHMFDVISTQNNAKEVKCDNFVSLGTNVICEVETLKSALKSLDNYDPKDHKLEIYLLDHTYPSSDNRSLTAILYGELGSKDFAEKHRILSAYADRGKLNYIVRWNIKSRGKANLRLSGYGVELQLKSTEYKSQDDSTPKASENEEMPALDEDDEDDPQNIIDGFNFAKLKSLYPDMRKNLEKFRRHLSDSSEELAPLKAWQMQALSMQAAAAVMEVYKTNPKEALDVLISISQNFPMQTKLLIHNVVPHEMRREVLDNQEIWSSSLFGLRPSESLLLVAGAQYETEEFLDIMGLLQGIKEDLKPMDVLYALGFSKDSINKLMYLESGETYAWEEYGIDIRDTAITWLNDLENDVKYRRWSYSYMELLRPTYPGMLRHIKRNIYNYVVIVDPLSTACGAALRLGDTLVKHAMPVRVGVVIAPRDARLAAAVRSAFNYILQEKNSNKDAYQFLLQLYDSKRETITLEDVKEELEKIAPSKADIDDILSETSEYNYGDKLVKEFITKLGSDIYPHVLINGVPLREEVGSGPLALDRLEEALVTALSAHTRRLQRAVFHNELSDDEDAIEYLMKQPYIVPKLNRRILSLEPNQFLDLSGTPSPAKLFTEKSIDKLLALTGQDALATALPLIKYFKNKVKDSKITQTIWVVGDLNDQKSRFLLRDALKFMSESSYVRVTFIPNVESSSSSDQSLNKVVVAALAVLDSQNATKYVSQLLEDEGCHEKQECNILPELVSALNKHEWVLKASRVLCARALGLRGSARAVVHNARFLPIDDNEEFAYDDFVLLERFSDRVYGNKITEALDKIKKTKNDDHNGEDEARELSPCERLKVISALNRRGTRARVAPPAALLAAHSALELPPLYDNEPAVDVVAVLDPASGPAQYLAPVLSVLRRVLNCHLKIYLNPIEKNSDMPLKSFYRYVLEPELQFAGDGAATGGAGARFARLPHSPLLSMELRTPSNWLVQCVKAVHDLDNIRLADVDSVVHSEFELEHLLLEGHAWDSTLGTPPRGLQLVLGSRRQPDLVDTIVMANFGYFQLKANPGAWILRLRPGRSEEIYEIVGHENTEEPAGSEDIQVLVSSLRSHVIKLRVSKRPEHQHRDLLDDDTDEKPQGIFHSIASSFGGGSGGEERDAEDDTINVFSVASGHLYERFLRIMMLSVIKNTKSPVKFWFLKNYLSPSFKDFLPHMAAEYKFQYELVQYQWPRWLHRQRDRQRTIWGYKILFLDVLFPLHVKKIIFVDADQIVSADLKELMELDLGGAPYGYTPFCDSRKEMEGFRFWKQGYWRNHLQGRPYHISALYVVDLRRFRRIAAGDRLRGQYQALSQDPNSLSNLDQDLPNNMIHQVAIKSLPQEWLWCETWCDDESKKYAKTIDLCNNPLTKEAKLSAAMRIVPEWKDYDREVKSLQERVRGVHHQASSSDERSKKADFNKTEEMPHSEL